MSALTVNNVSIRYRTGDFKDIGLKEYVMRKATKNYKVNEFWADRHVSFTLEKGDMLGIIGTNGAGKSTLLKVVSGIMEPSEGSVKREGNIAALLELASGFDGDLTVKENTYLRGAMLGYTKKFMDDTYDQIIEFAELQDFQDRPFKQLSSGMKSRLAFSIASLVKPDILVLDEVLSVGDGAFRKKSEDKMREIIKGGATTILVSHSLDQVRQMCNKVLWLHKGEQIAFGENVQEICDQYQAFLEGNMELPERCIVKDMDSIEQNKESRTNSKQASDKKIDNRGLKIPATVKADVLSIALVSTALFALMYVLLGFAKGGLNVPYTYAGGDEFSIYACVKALLDGDMSVNMKIGAPYGSNLVDFLLNSVTNVEFTIIRIMFFLTGNLYASINLEFLLVYPLCAITAFSVLRYLKIKRPIALCGAVLYACMPYIARRNVSHMGLNSIYFVPLVLLLCLWILEPDDQYISIHKGWWKSKKNIALIIMTLLIANHGNGYYPIFSCFFLCVTGFYGLIVHRNKSVIKKTLVPVALIASFFVVSLIPYLRYQLENGPIWRIKSLASVETYSLKIANLFVPLNSHGNDFLANLIQTYRTNPLVNENTSSYLGIAGITGFIISLVLLFCPMKENARGEEGLLHYFARLNIAAVLLGTIGGFSSLLALMGFRFIRAYNRLSIFIFFISICILCFYIQKICSWVKLRKGKAIRLAAYAALILLFCVSMYDLLPTYGANDIRFESNKANYLSDDKFVKEIETHLAEDDMVYQLPYHKYPETGNVNKMFDYNLFTGYLHSDTLRWSYGGTKDRESDQWNSWVNTFPMDIRLKTIIGAGFKGIYIDTLAYTEDGLAELRDSIEMILQIQPLVSDNGKLLFYDLYPYIEQNPDLLSFDPLVYHIGEQIGFTMDNGEGQRFFSEGLSHAETNYTWTLGKEAKLHLRFDEKIDQSLVLRIELANIYRSSQHIIASQGDMVLCDQVVNDREKPLEIYVPKECVKDGWLDITFAFPDAISPKELGKSNDARVLALGLRSFSVNYVDASLSTYEFGETLGLNANDSSGNRYFTEGLSKAEPEFTWTNGKKARLLIPLSDNAGGGLALILNISRVYNGTQRVQVAYGDLTIYDGVLTGEKNTMVIPLPIECMKDRLLNFTFSFPDAVSPKELGKSNDTRRLALAMKSFRIDMVEK